jgi:hypothetical protein
LLDTEKKLAATYSRGVYKTTTIGKTVFDGRVRNGNGSDHSFMATKNRLVEAVARPADTPERDGLNVSTIQRACSLKTAHRRILGNYVRELKSPLFPDGKKKAIKPHDRLVLVR